MWMIITLVAIGVGSNLRRTLFIITDKIKHVFEVDYFQSLDQISDGVQKIITNAGKLLRT